MKRRLIDDNLNEIIRVLFRYFEIDFDDYTSYLYRNHPRYGNIEAIAYILSRFGIDSSLVETDMEEIVSMPFPLIINYDGLFLPIMGVDKSGSFIILNESGERENVNLGGGGQGWDNRVLVLNKDGKGYRNLSKEKIIRKFCRIIVITAWVFIGTFFVGLSANTLFQHNFIRNYFLISSIIGLFISVLFHIQRLNRGNPLVNKICHSSSNHSSKRDCSSILDSNASKFFNLISWVDIGSLYFSLFLLVVWIIPTQEATVNLLLISIIASLYIPYSIYYQAIKAKRWCILCLSIQAILLFNALVSITYIIKFGLAGCCILLGSVEVAVVALIIVPCYFIIINTISSNYLLKKTEIRHREFIFSPEVIQWLIYETPEIDFSLSAKMPIIRREGDAELTMIINPLCSPCMKETRTVLEILNRKRYTNLSVIFLTDPKAKTEVDQAKILITEAIDGNLAKTLEKYSNQFPAINETNSNRSIHLDAQKILDTHFNWCKKNNYLSTPKLFLNNHELPSLYSVKDIDFLIE